jgi:hypothetical protein
MGGAVAVWGSGTRSITRLFWDGETVTADCVLHDEDGYAAEFIVDGWTGLDDLPAPSLGADATTATASFAVPKDLVFTVNITETPAYLRTQTVTGETNLQSNESAGGVVTPGDQYELHSVVPLWLSVNQGFDLIPKADAPDGWTLKVDGLAVGGHASEFLPFEVDPAHPGTFGEPHPDFPGEFKGDPDPKNPGKYKLKLDPGLTPYKYPNYRSYARDMDGNYIVPGTGRTLVIKWTDPDIPMPTDGVTPWRMYGKQARLTSADTISQSFLGDPKAAVNAGVYYLETGSPAKLDSTRDKSGNILIHGEVDESLRRN